MDFHKIALDQQLDINLIKEGLKRTYKERFLIATMLSKVQLAIHKPTLFYHPFKSFQKTELELFTKYYAKNI